MILPDTLKGHTHVEPKADGWWCSCTFDVRCAFLESRGGIEIDSKYDMPDGILSDEESTTIYSEHLLNTPWGKRFSAANGGVELLAFDLDHPGPYSHRRAALAELVDRLALPWLGLLPTFPATSAQFVVDKFVNEQGWEGIVTKCEDTPPGGYLDRAKEVSTFDFVITGITESTSPWRTGMASGFTYGAYKEGELITLGKVCAGLKHDQLLQALDDPKKYIGQVIELAGHSLTRKGCMREARYVRMRSALDKRPKECVWKAGES